jgi:hypothetical protein
MARFTTLAFLCRKAHTRQEIGRRPPRRGTNGGRGLTASGTSVPAPGLILRAGSLVASHHSPLPRRGHDRHKAAAASCATRSGVDLRGGWCRSDPLLRPTSLLRHRPELRGRTTAVPVDRRRGRTARRWARLFRRTRSQASSYRAGDASCSSSRSQPRRRTRVARDVLGTSDRLAVRVAEVPLLSRQDEPTHELAVDVLGAPAGGASSAAHPPASHDGDRLLRMPRCSGLAYFLSSRARARPLHLDEQYLWCSVIAWYSRQHLSQWRRPKAGVTRRRSPFGLRALQVAHKVWLPWCG